MKEFNRELLELVIRPTLMGLDLYSPEAEQLVFGTGLAESGLRELEQGYGKKAGPALGFWQCEPASYYDYWKNYIDYRSDLEQKIVETCNLNRIPKAEAMIWNLRLACAMARVHYKRVPEKLPKDIKGMAKYWKKYYNTPLGKGTPEHFLKAWENR